MGAILHLWKKKTKHVRKSLKHRERDSRRRRSRHGGCVYLCPHGGLCYVRSLWEPRGFQGVREEGGWGKWDEQCSLVHCTLSAVLPLACFVRRRPLWNPLRNGKSGPSETTTQTPYPHTSSSVPQNPWQQRQGQEGSEAREKRGGALKKRSARFSGSRIQAPWPCAAWMWPSVFSSPAHFHLDMSE